MTAEQFKAEMHSVARDHVECGERFRRMFSSLAVICLEGSLCCTMLDLLFLSGLLIMVAIFTEREARKIKRESLTLRDETLQGMERVLRQKGRKE